MPKKLPPTPPEIQLNSRKMFDHQLCNRFNPEKENNNVTEEYYLSIECQKTNDNN